MVGTSSDPSLGDPVGPHHRPASGLASVVVTGCRFSRGGGASFVAFVCRAGSAVVAVARLPRCMFSRCTQHACSRLLKPRSFPSSAPAYRTTWSLSGELLCRPHRANAPLPARLSTGLRASFVAPWHGSISLPGAPRGVCEATCSLGSLAAACHRRADRTDVRPAQRQRQAQRWGRRADGSLLGISRFLPLRSC